jgi:hypothetical protein
MNDLLKLGLTKTSVSTSLFLNMIKVEWHMGVQRNLQSFLVNVKRGFAILAYPTINLMYTISPRNALTFVVVLGVGKCWIIVIFLGSGCDPTLSTTCLINVMFLDPKQHLLGFNLKLTSLSF